jgi:hypothetical protein
MTLHPDANRLLAHAADELRAVLGDQLAAVLVYGSLALGGFNPLTSDVDFVVVTETALNESELAALAAMHHRLFRSGLALADQIECSYIPRAGLRRYDPANAHFPRLDRGEDRLSIQQHDTDWVIQRYSLREHGFAVLGPEPRALIDPISPSELRQAVLDLLWWWQLQLREPQRVAQPGYQVYSVLSMCRILYTLRQGGIVSKPAAARWALQALPARFHPLIARAAAWQGGAFDHLQETLALIRYTLEEANTAQ